MSNEIRSNGNYSSEEPPEEENNDPGDEFLDDEPQRKPKGKTLRKFPHRRGKE